jgi:hypothetical protein
LTYRLARDADDLVAAKYQVEAIPRTLIIDKKGIVRADIVGGREYAEFRQELKKVGL